jgi:hypothetical protein
MKGGYVLSLLGNCWLFKNAPVSEVGTGFSLNLEVKKKDALWSWCVLNLKPSLNTEISIGRLQIVEETINA